MNVTECLRRSYHLCVAGDGNDRDEATGISAVDYHWTDTERGEGLSALSAEQWLRRVWEDAPPGLRVFLRFGWRFGLGLRLGPSDDVSYVVGWHIDSSTDRTVVVSASSRILSATNTLTAEDDMIRWETDVRFVHIVGRLVWPLAALLHQRIVPWSVRRAIAQQLLAFD